MTVVRSIGNFDRRTARWWKASRRDFGLMLEMFFYPNDVRRKRKQLSVEGSILAGEGRINYFSTRNNRIGQLERSRGCSESRKRTGDTRIRRHNVLRGEKLQDEGKISSRAGKRCDLSTLNLSTCIWREYEQETRKSINSINGVWLCAQSLPTPNSSNCTLCPIGREKHKLIKPNGCHSILYFKLMSRDEEKTIPFSDFLATLQASYRISRPIDEAQSFLSRNCLFHAKV